MYKISKYSLLYEKDFMTDKKEKTQQIIKDTALKLFATLGYNATTTALIAHEAIVSEAIIFKYFKNKEGLLKAISEYALDEIIENISLIPLVKNLKQAQEYPLYEFLKSVIVERLSFLEKNFELTKLILIEMQYSESLQARVRNILFPKAFQVVDSIKNILIEKAEITELKACAVIRIILGVIESYALQKYVFNLEISEQELNQEINEILNILQKGCA